MRQSFRWDTASRPHIFRIMKFRTINVRRAAVHSTVTRLPVRQLDPRMALKKSELYSSLWKSCDELRGGMDASQGF